uniref:Uncharacterized protein n=1 Tax=Oryza barthii TaxID=65489 RepID=A0A0D3H0C6_9ORYZ
MAAAATNVNVKPLNGAEGYLRDAWDAVARTYDNADAASAVAQRMLYDDLALDGAPLLERIARAEALNAATRVTLSLSDAELAELLCQTVLPANAAAAIRSGAATMRDVWRVARIMEAQRIRREDEALHGKCRKCGRSRYHGCNCMR